MNFKIILISVISTIIFKLILSSPAGARGQAVLHQVRQAMTTSHSHNWAGYVAKGGEYTSVTGTWIVPNTTDSIIGADATWVGIGGVSSDDLIQAGTQTVVDHNGNISYHTWYELLPEAARPLHILIKAGDSVTATVTKQNDDTWLISFTNNTSGKSTQITKKYSSTLSSAEWIEEAPVGRRNILPLADFGIVTFSNASTVKNGETVTPEEAGAKPVNMVNSLRQTLASTSDLTSDGRGFSVQRQTEIAAAPQENEGLYFRIDLKRGLEEIITREWELPDIREYLSS